jgi:hypothetical protein
MNCWGLAFFKISNVLSLIGISFYEQEPAHRSDQQSNPELSEGEPTVILCALFVLWLLKV